MDLESSDGRRAGAGTAKAVKLVAGPRTLALQVPGHGATGDGGAVENTERRRADTEDSARRNVMASCLVIGSLFEGGPQMGVGACLDQLCGYTYPVTGSPDRSLQHVTHVQITGHIGNLDVLAFVRE